MCMAMHSFERKAHYEDQQVLCPHAEETQCIYRIWVERECLGGCCSAVPRMQLENTYDVDLSQSLGDVPHLLVSTERLINNR